MASTLFLITNLRIVDASNLSLFNSRVDSVGTKHVPDIYFEFHLSFVRNRYPRSGSTLIVVFVLNLPGFLQNNFWWQTW